MRLFFSAG